MGRLCERLKIASKKSLSLFTRIPFTFSVVHHYFDTVKWKTYEIEGCYCRVIFIGKQYSSSQMSIVYIFVCLIMEK